MELEQFKVVKGEVKGRQKHLDVRLEMLGSYPCEVALHEKGNRYVAVVNDGRVAGSVPKEYTKSFLNTLDSGLRIQCIVLSGIKPDKEQYKLGNDIIQECLYLKQRGHEVESVDATDTDEEESETVAKPIKKERLG